MCGQLLARLKEELLSEVVYGVMPEGGRKGVEVLLKNLIVEVKNI